MLTTLQRFVLCLFCFWAVVAPVDAAAQESSTDATSNTTVTDQSAESPPAMARFEKVVDDAAGQLVGFLASIIFYPIFDIPLAVLWLVTGATFFTVYLGFINLRAFWHAIWVTTGHYDDPNDSGEVTHFQALTAALGDGRSG